jgi:hypothetical protein
MSRTSTQKKKLSHKSMFVFEIKIIVICTTSYESHSFFHEFADKQKDL